MRKMLSCMFIFGSMLTASPVFAKDITGIWQHIDDKSGNPQATIEIKKEANNTYSGTVINLIKRPGYTPPPNCVNCPAPYTNQPILGMTVLKGLKNIDGTSSYHGGRVIDPLNGQIYDAKMKLNPSGKRLSLRAYMGASILGRNQTWVRIQ
nr:DUF2147 domain-containing protein [Acinetobacter tandoii]